MELPVPNKEQQIILDHAEAGKSVMVSSVAGCGKTCCGLHITKILKEADKQVLLIVYNANLKMETRQAQERLELDNMVVHSYHSFAMQYFGSPGHTDLDLMKMFERNIKPKQAYHFDTIIMDEQQDMTPLYFRVAHEILKRNKCPSPQLICFGDVNQNLYSFMGSDARFLTLAQSLFKHPAREWITAGITTSSRVPGSIAGFINSQLLGSQTDGDRILSNRLGGRVLYAHCDAFSVNVFQMITALLKKHSPEDVMILAPSLRGAKTPVHLLENKLVANRIPCMVPTSDEQHIDPEVTKHKLLFCTYHQSKGLGRPVVVVFGLDDSYHQYYARDESQDMCPNAVYVAATRASKRLIVIHHNRRGFFPTINQDTFKNYVTYWPGGPQPPTTQEAVKVVVTKKTTVTSLLRHLSTSAVYDALQMVEQKEIHPAGDAVELPDRVLSAQGLVEAVNDVNGIVVPAMYELETSGGCSILDICLSARLPTNHKKKLREMERILRDKRGNREEKLEALCYVAVVYQTVVSGYMCKLEQIDNFDWLTLHNVQLCTDRLGQVVSREAAYEVPVSAQYADTQINGSMDIEDSVNSIVWETKCTEVLTGEHILQIAMYAALHNQPNYKYRLFNVMNGQIIEVSIGENKSKLMSHLLMSKNGKSENISDEEFLRKCLQQVS